MQVLEIALALPEGEGPPEWVAELVDSGAPSWCVVGSQEQSHSPATIATWLVDCSAACSCGHLGQLLAAIQLPKINKRAAR